MKQANQRLLSLDVFRGFTIVLMIIVNSSGNDHPYWWIDHSLWNGCTLADLVFPFFLFIMGISLTFSLTRRQQQGESFSRLFWEITRRSIIIFLLGLILNAIGHRFEFSTMRIMGVLQRIGIVYFFAATLFLITSARLQLIIIIFILFAYYFTMTFIPVPGFGAGNLTAAGNLAAYIDRFIFGSRHIFFHGQYDPEGVLSTLPAIATALLGNLTGTLLQSSKTANNKFLLMMAVGIFSLLCGWSWNAIFPINKALWTSSYVLWTAGFSWIIFGLCYWVLDIKHWKSWSKFFEIFGLNAIVVYFLHILFLEMQDLTHITIDHTQVNLRIYITQHLFGWASIHNASLLYSLCYVMLWFLVLAILYRNKIFIKI